MSIRLIWCVGLPAAVAAPGLAAPAAARVNAPSFEPAAQFARHVTVRVTGMPLDQLLPRLSAELEVSLRTAALDVGDLRVSVFAEDLPASRVLTALTSMLNMKPEGGYGWSRERRRSRPGYQLYRSQQARLQAAERLRRGEAALAAAFRSRVRGLKEDPARLKQWQDPNPVPRLQRGSLLLASLTETQLGRLQRDGILLLRQPEATPEQQKIIARLVADLRGSIDGFLSEHPEEVPRYEGIDPAATSVVFELHQQTLSQSVVMRVNLGPDKGGSRNSVWSSPRDATQEHALTAHRQPATGDNLEKGKGRKIALKPRAWSMAAVLSDLARRLQEPLVADCYSVSWADLRGLPPLPLDGLLDEISRRCEMRWERREGFVLLRSRMADARQAAEVPPRLLDRWLGQIERDRVVGLETLLELCQLSDAQLFHLREQWEIGRLIPNLNFLAWSIKHPVRLFGTLPAAQRVQVAQGGLRMTFQEMTPLQRRQFAFWAMVREPDLPESEYERGALQMRLTEDGRWQVTLSVGGRTSADTSWLAVGRNWSTGAPQVVATAVTAEALIGQPAPPLTVKSLEGKPYTLPVGRGHAFLVLFRDVWVTPYVGGPTDAGDLDALAGLLERRPELRERVAVVCPREPAAALRQWASEHGKGLPIYADELGSVVQAYGRGPLPRAILITPEGRIQAVETGYSRVLAADWSVLLR